MLFWPAPMTRRKIAEADDLVLGRRDVAGDLPGEIRARDRRERRLQLDPVIVHLADVGELRPRESSRRRKRLLHDLVYGVLVIVGEVEIQSLEQLCLEAELDFLAALRLEIGVAEGVRP